MTTIFVNVVKTPSGNFTIAPTRSCLPNIHNSCFTLVLGDSHSAELQKALVQNYDMCWKAAEKIAGTKNGCSKAIYNQLMQSSLSMMHLYIDMGVLTRFNLRQVSLVFPTIEGERVWKLGYTLGDILKPRQETLSADQPDPERWPDAPRDPLPWED